mgnify:FL=1|jgi:hypothetical protein
MSSPTKARLRSFSRSSSPKSRKTVRSSRSSKPNRRKTVSPARIYITDLTYIEVGKYESRYLNDDELVCTINYHITQHDPSCNLYIDAITMVPKYRNQKLSKPILLDFMNIKKERPVCLENRIGTYQYPFPEGATDETKSKLFNLYSSIGFRRRDTTLVARHPNYNDMILTDDTILTAGGHKRLKPRNKRSKRRNVVSNKKNSKSKKRS